MDKNHGKKTLMTDLPSRLADLHTALEARIAQLCNCPYGWAVAHGLPPRFNGHLENCKANDLGFRIIAHGLGDVVEEMKDAKTSLRKV